nr:MAG TPA: hypothetical protein [Caudoviricetes sp.]
MIFSEVARKSSRKGSRKSRLFLPSGEGVRKND